MDTRILLTIYIFVDHFKMKTDNSARILGHTDLFPEEKGKRTHHTPSNLVMTQHMLTSVAIFMLDW